MTEHITWSTALRLTANLLTVTSCVAWLKFADTREGVLSAPNMHHRIYLRLLLGLSGLAFASGIISLAVATRQESRPAHVLAAPSGDENAREGAGPTGEPP